jgi:tight adherence protein C
MSPCIAFNSILLAAAMPEMRWLGSLVMGAAVTVLAWWLFRVMQSEDFAQGAEWRYDVSRINELRRIDLLYRMFYPVIELAARFNRSVFPAALPRMQRELQAAGLPRFWLAEEYLGKLELIALFTLPLYVYWLFSWLGAAGLMMAVIAVMATAWLLRLRLSRLAAERLKQIKRRMPFVLDLLTLLMQAGATFLNSLRQAVEEFAGHPVAEEFGRVLTDINMGKTRIEAFQAMRDRLADDEITSIIGSILQGEQLGTPLGNIFRTQADVLRLKRTQRAETIAGEAGVNMLLPAVIVMMATVLIILGPFVLSFLRFGVTMS